MNLLLYHAVIPVSYKRIVSCLGDPSVVPNSFYSMSVETRTALILDFTVLEC